MYEQTRICQHQQLARQCLACENEADLAALKAEIAAIKVKHSRDREWLRDMEREVARMKPVFDAAVAVYTHRGYDSGLSLALEDEVRKLGE